MYKFEKRSSNIRNRIPNAQVRGLLLFATTGALLASTGINYADALEHRHEHHRTSPAEINVAPGVCDEPAAGLTGEPLKKAAETCLEDLAVPVVMVGFGMDDKTLNSMKDASESSIIDGFDGTIQPRIEAIQASSEAERLLHDRDDDCVDTRNLEEFVSKIADETMDLKKYRRIIGLTTLKACQPIGGVTSHTSDGRYMDVYGVPSGPVKNYNDILNKSSDVAHEFGHGVLKLGHSGAQSGLMSYKSEIYRGESTSPLENTDIGSMVANEEYNEYGNTTDIMAKTLSATGTILNNFQRRKIMWPQRALEQSKDPLEIVNGKTLEFGAASESQFDFAALRLDEPVTAHYTDNDRDTQYLPFDYLVVDPLLPDEGSPFAARIYLANKESAETIAIAILIGSHRQGAHTLEQSYTIGGQSLYVAVTSDTITVTDTSK